MLCLMFDGLFFFFKQKTAYELRISDWSSDVCSSDLIRRAALGRIARACAVDQAGVEQRRGVDVGGAQQRRQPFGAGEDHGLLPRGKCRETVREAFLQNVRSVGERSEERRVGKECGRTWRCRG